MSDSAAEAEHELAGRAGAVAPTWLNLGVHGLYRDVRKLIYTKLDAFDRALVEAAHMSNRTVTLDEAFARKCAKRGHLGCSGHEQTVVAGMHGPVQTRPLVDTCTCCNGREKAGVLGGVGSAQRQLRMGIFKCCSGRERTAVLGMSGRVQALPKMVI